MDTLEPRSWPEENIGPVPPRMTTRTSSSASARRKASFELDQQPPVLGVAGLGPVQHDPDDRDRPRASRSWMNLSSGIGDSWPGRVGALQDDTSVRLWGVTATSARGLPGRVGAPFRD